MSPVLTYKILFLFSRILVGHNVKAQNRTEIAKLKPVVEELRISVISNNNTIEHLKQQIELGKTSLVDSRVKNRFQINAAQQKINDIKKEMENAQQIFNAKRDELMEQIRQKKERVQTDQPLAERTEPNQQDNLEVVNAVNEISPSLSSSTNSVDPSYLISKRAKITNEEEMDVTFDSDSDPDNLDFFS